MDFRFLHNMHCILLFSRSEFYLPSPFAATNNVPQFVSMLRIGGICACVLFVFDFSLGGGGGLTSIEKQHKERTNDREMITQSDIESVRHSHLANETS